MKTMASLVVPFALKAAADTSSRTFEGLAATWDLDLGNDVIKKGAFKKTLQEWKSTGKTIPLLNSHDHYDIFSAIGQLIDAKETTDGLWTKWEVIDGPEGDAALARMRPSPTTGKAIVNKMSIGFQPTKFSYEQPEGTTGFFDRIRNIEEAGLEEVSLVLFPMQPNASIDSSTVKMFMKMAQDTDPTKLDGLTKAGLRKLASRIGTLLKKQDPPAAREEGEEDEVDDDEIEDTETPPKAKATGTPPVTDPPEADEDEIVDPNLGKSSDAKSDPVIYPYQEALAQRLRSVGLKHKVAGIGSK